MSDYDYEAIANGSARIKKAARTVDRREYTDKPGSDWRVKRENIGSIEFTEIFHHGVYGRAVLGYSEDGMRYVVHSYTYGGAERHPDKEYRTLDAALKYGARITSA